MIKFHLLYCTIMFSCVENVNPIIGIGACCYNRSLIFVLCVAISFRGYIPSSFPWFCKHEITISMFAGNYYSSHHFFGLPFSIVSDCFCFLLTIVVK